MYGEKTFIQGNHVCMNEFIYAICVCMYVFYWLYQTVRMVFTYIRDKTGRTERIEAMIYIKTDVQKSNVCICTIIDCRNNYRHIYKL